MQNQINEIRKLVERRDSKKAEVAIAKLLRLDIAKEDEFTLLILRVHTRLISGRPSDAILDWQTANDLDSIAASKPEVQELLGDCYLARFEMAAVGFVQKMDLREAHQIYQRIVSLNPDYDNTGWIYYQQGRISLTEGQSYIAESLFHKALFSPSNVAALTAYCYERLGFVAYYESRQPKQALIYLNKAVDTYPTSEPRLWLVQVYILRSRVLRETNLDAAIESAHMAYELARSRNKHLSAEALLTLAELLSVNNGRETEVVDFIQQFIQVSKAPLGVDVTWSRAYEMLGDSHFAMGRYAESIIAYENALQYNPDHPWGETIYYRIAKSNYQQQQYAEVVNNLQSIISDSRDYRVFNLLANAYYGLREFKQAAWFYQAAIKLAPSGINIETMQAYYELSKQMNSPL